MATKVSQQKIPSFQGLLSESWVLFKASLGKIFVVSLLWIGVTVLVFIAAVVYSVLRFVSWQNQVYGGNLGNSPADFIPRLLSQAPDIVIVAVVAFLSLIAIQMLSAISAILVLKYKDEGVERSVFAIAKESLRDIGPVFISGIVIFILSLGGFFLLVIPGVIITFMLGFVQYEIVVARKGVKEALTGSLQIISQNLGEILSKSLLYFIAYVVIFVIVPAGIRTYSKEAGIIVELIVGICNLFTGLFGSIYGFLLYKYAREATDDRKQSSLNWVIVTAVLGYLLVLFIVNLVITNLPKSNKVKDAKVYNSLIKPS